MLKKFAPLLLSFSASAFASSSASITMNGIPYQLVDGKLVPIVNDQDSSLYVVEAAFEEGKLQYEIGPNFLNVRVIPRGSYITHGQRSQMYGSVVIMGSPVDSYSLVRASGQTLNLLSYAKQQKLQASTLKQYRMAWDTSETGLAKHQAILEGLNASEKMAVLRLWDGDDKLSLCQFTRLLANFEGSARFEAASILCERLPDCESLSGEDLLQLVQGQRKDREENEASDEALDFLAKHGKLSKEQKVAWIAQASPRHLATRLTRLSQDERGELEPETLEAWWAKASGLSDSAKLELLQQLFAPGQIEAEALATISSDSYRVDAIRYAFGRARQARPEQINGALRLIKSDSYKADALAAMDAHLALLSDATVADILVTTSDSYKADVIGGLKGKMQLSWLNAERVFQKCSDSYKTDLIKAGLFDGSAIDDGKKLKLTRSCSNSYKGDILSALELRY